MSPSSSCSASTLDLSYYRILSIATPVLIANLAMPLQGAIDVAVVGHFPQQYSLAGLGIASQLWLLILVNFNFLQYASSGLSSQAVGRQSATGKFSPELEHILYRSIGLAIILASILWLFKPILIDFGLDLLGAQSSSRQAAQTYIEIRYFGIAFEMMNYAFIGWFAGQGKTKQMMMVQVLVSVINIVLTLTFVYFLDMGLQGVALGTVIAYAFGCLTATLLARYHIHQMHQFSAIRFNGNTTSKTMQRTTSVSTQELMQDQPNSVEETGHINKQLLFISGLNSLQQHLSTVFAFDKMRHLFSLNKDIFIRTLLLTLSFAWITRLSAQQGDLVMATNAILLQVLSISAFALDGVAVAAESLSGQAVAYKGSKYFKLAVKNTGITIFWLAVTLSLIWLLVLPSFLGLMTDLQAVNTLALDYRYVAALLPLIGAGAYWLDGIMFGLTAGSKIREVAIIVALIFFPITWAVYKIYGAHYAMPVIWFSVYWLLLSRFVVAGIVLWRHKQQLIYKEH